mgnify:CR=1 FL=1|jgi:hypothetical protein
MRTTYSPAFALPTVIITSIVMFMVLLVSLTGVTSTTANLKRQHVDKLLLTAAESGLEMAQECLDNGLYGGAPQWSNGAPLKQNTQCTGSELVACTYSSTDSRCFLSKDGNLRVGFEVKYTLDDGGNLKDIRSKGVVAHISKTGQQAVKIDSLVLRDRKKGTYFPY